VRGNFGSPRLNILFAGRTTFLHQRRIKKEAPTEPLFQEPALYGGKYGPGCKYNVWKSGTVPALRKKVSALIRYLLFAVDLPKKDRQALRYGLFH
jgi:hypothetical protein